MATYPYRVSSVLSRLATSVQQNDLDQTVPLAYISTYGNVVEAITNHLSSHRGLEFQPGPHFRTPEQRVKLRESARGLMDITNRTAGLEADATTKFGSPRDLALPIRSQGHLHQVGVPPQPSAEKIKRVKDKFKDDLIPSSPDPYPVLLRAFIEDQKLAVVFGNLILSAIDHDPSDPSHIVTNLQNVTMLWDTGAQSTIITADILPTQFQTHLQSHSINKNYRLGIRGHTRVQISAIIEFSNTVISLDTIATVIPNNQLPNFRSGVLLGQLGMIEKLVYKSVPRSILLARGENVSNDVWGDIIIEQYLDLDDRLISV